MQMLADTRLNTKLEGKTLKQSVKSVLPLLKQIIPLWEKDDRVEDSFKSIAGDAYKTLNAWARGKASEKEVYNWEVIMSGLESALDLITPFKETSLAIITRTDMIMNWNVPGTWSPIAWAIRDSIHVINKYTKMPKKQLYREWESKV